MTECLIIVRRCESISQSGSRPCAGPTNRHWHRQSESTNTVVYDPEPRLAHDDFVSTVVVVTVEQSSARQTLQH